MNFRQFFSKFFNNHSETSENHWDQNLQTHYFKTTKDKGFQVIEDYFNKSSNCEIVALSKEHGEISVNFSKGRKAFVVATVIMVRPYRTAVDFSVTTESVIPFDLGYSHNLIPKLYDELKKELTYIEDPKRNNAQV
ncbi:cytosolic protein [Sediminibacillus massiliensis]|uniref:cytosolic protein n=1 Tax=Sediminibacillus massiliensis TaxID=1926277 RepID=UPI00098830CE|nr:cytosolic protein [Sediminibacillus massiliensis]